MSNNAVPDAAAVFRALEAHDLTVRSMNIEKDAQNLPLAARFTFKESARNIPADLPSTMMALGREIPVIYDTPKP